MKRVAWICGAMLVIAWGLAGASPSTGGEQAGGFADGALPFDVPQPGASQPAVWQHMPVWRALLLVYPSIDVDYVDEGGVPRHLTQTLPDSQIQKAVWSFRGFPSIAHDFSNGEAVIQNDIVYVPRPIDSLTQVGGDKYTVYTKDTRPELDTYAPTGTYDSIFVLWPQMNVDTGHTIPMAGWGLAFGRSSATNGATYAAISNAPDYWWNEPSIGEVWLHEWLHNVCWFYAGRGYTMPQKDADGGGDHGYSSNAQYYRDLMTGKVLEDEVYTGITPIAWQGGSVLGTEADVLIDPFYSNTTGLYARSGSVTWDSSERNIKLGNGAASNNKMYVGGVQETSFTVAGQVLVPPVSSVGPYDSVAVALRNDNVEYWGILLYGTSLTERNHITISRNDSGGTLYPLTLSPGWYSVKMLVDYPSAVLKMKAWPDGENEPGWQVSRSLDSGWVSSGVGFRHYGTGTRVDDLVAQTVPVIECSYQLVPTSMDLDYSGGNRSFAVQATTGCNWTPKTSDTWITITSGSNSGFGLAKFSAAANTSTSARSGKITVEGQTFTINQAGSPVKEPSLSLDKSVLYFNKTTSWEATGDQIVRVTIRDSSNVRWRAESNKSWIQVWPIGEVTSSGNFEVHLDRTSAPRSGHWVGQITVTSSQVANSPQTVSVAGMSYQAGATGGPMGYFDSPSNGATGVTGNIPVSGWVLDDIEVTGVKIWRGPVAGEGSTLIFIGDAVFVEGARPDVEAAYAYPFDYRAGWGYMLLTNFLPNQGNGTFIIHAIAEDKEGHSLLLGSKTITCNNRNGVNPFGTIDTPAQGATVSGSSYRNWGWALTPAPKSIPTNGSTLTVWVDGAQVGNVTYGFSRPDIQKLFPGYANTNTAVGYFDLDTTKYENGVHNIAWRAEDNAGRVEGLGSRFFIIMNSGSASTSGGHPYSFSL